MRTFIIGYGSLINRSSLNRTLPIVKDIEPVYLNNYKRSWNALEDQTVSLSTTYVGIEKSPDSVVNGIIFEIPEELLGKLDSREFLYYREKVDLHEIDFLSNKFNITENDNTWIYVTKNPKKPNEKSPIIQSYVDVCLSGCIDIEDEFKVEDFAKNFILQTTNWSKNWVNDRIFPRAPHIHQPMAYKIDRLLFENINEHFKGITIE